MTARREVFADTSAFLALLSAGDRRHARAKRTFERLRAEQALLITTSYVLSETYALLDRRLGREAVLRFREDFEPLLSVTWVGREEHDAGLDRLRTLHGSVSLTDAVSFLVAARVGVREAFAYDPHFRREGLTLL